MSHASLIGFMEHRMQARHNLVRTTDDSLKNVFRLFATRIVVLQNVFRLFATLIVVLQNVFRLSATLTVVLQSVCCLKKHPTKLILTSLIDNPVLSNTDDLTM
jgi:hypothetical protein